MLREVTLGQYYPVDSVIHRLDPRVKLLGTVLFLISLFIVKSWIMYGVAALALAILIKISNVPFRFMTRGLKSIVILLLISVSFNLFLTPGEVLVQFWIASSRISCSRTSSCWARRSPAATSVMPSRSRITRSSRRFTVTTTGRH